MVKKPIKILLTDTHLEESTIKNNINIHIQVRDLAIELGIKKISHLGDIFESRKAQPLETLNTFDFQILPLYHDKDIEMEIIPGNHDKKDYESENSYCDQFRYHPKLNIIKNWSVEEHEEFFIHYIPFFKESTAYLPYLKQATDFCKENTQKFHILFTHCGIMGAIGNENSVQFESVPIELFKPFKIVKVGHFHNRSEFANISYIGSTDPRIFSEDNEKGVEVMYSDGSFEFIKLNYTEYHILDVDLNVLNLAQIDEFVANCNDGDRYRLDIKGPKEKLDSLDPFTYKSKGVEVKKIYPSLSESLILAKEQKSIQFNANSIVQEFEAFCGLNQFNVEIGKKHLEKHLQCTQKN